jgi:outer membrane biosynthesis protein TonB
VKDPRRLVADGETSELSRALLAAGRARRAPKGAHERVWGAVAVGLASGVATTAATGAAAAGAGASPGAGVGAKGAGVALALTKTKLLVAGAVIAITASALVVAADRASSPAPVPAAAPTHAPAAANAPAEPQPGADPHAEATAREVTEEPGPNAGTARRVRRIPQANARRSAAVKPNAEPPEVPEATVGDEPAPERSAISNLREEAALLGQARAALARGDATAASARLDEARTRFPQSQLGQERDALDVRIASASGDRARAASLARAFAVRYPDSPLRAGVEAIARAPEKP